MSKRAHYNHVRVTLTPTIPPPKTWMTPTYHLESYSIRRHVKTVNVQLHGMRGHEKRTESISFPLLPAITDAELVRAAACLSPNKWTVSFMTNARQFSGRFTSPLNEQMLAALMGAPGSSPTAQSAPTFATTSVYPPQLQPPIPQPGQFQQPFVFPTPAGSRQGAWQWYKSRSKRTKIVLWFALIAFLIFASIVGSAIGSTAPNTNPTPSPTAQQAAVLVASPTLQTIKPTPTQTPKAQPTTIVTAKPTVKSTPRPTQPPATPTPCPGVNCNPWGYNFSPGNYINAPDQSFCSYFTCIGNFWNGNGYVVECADGEYSMSGGIQGACSHHGGVWRPLYSH